MSKVWLFIVFVLLVGAFGFLFSIMQQPTKSTTNANELTLPYGQKDVMKAQTTAVPTVQPTPEITIDPETLPKSAVIKTDKGDITLELYPDVAPKTVANFANKAKSGFYENLTFHRVEDWVLQGGDPDGNGTGGGNMPTEFNDKPYVVGSLGVARRNDPTVQNDAQFFITKTEASWLNNQYTNFGLVTAGMEVVNEMKIGDKILGITVE